MTPENKPSRKPPKRLVLRKPEVVDLLAAEPVGKKSRLSDDNFMQWVSERYDDTG